MLHLLRVRVPRYAFAVSLRHGMPWNVVLDRRIEGGLTLRFQSRLATTSLTVALAAALGWGLGAITPTQARDDDTRDPGVAYERDLLDHSEQLFGFGKPLAASATMTSSTEPGDKAVDLAKGLKARVVSNRVGENADQIALWPDDQHPTYAIICNEINGTQPGAQASVQRVRLSDGMVTDMISGMISCDPVVRTAWGTIVAGEEAGSSGRLWEIFDPLNVSGVTVNRTAATSSDPDHVVARTAVGQVSWEGNALYPDGTMYYGDELRPSNGKPGGGIYKFVPTNKYATGAGSLKKLSDSPLADGTVYVLRLGSGTSYGQGANTGGGTWVALPKITGTDQSLADAALVAGGYTGYYRPEDFAIDPLAEAAGKVRFCWTNTGNDTVQQWGEVLCLEDTATSNASYLTGAQPVVQPFVIGNPSLRMPDNLQFQPKTGILYILMDAATSAENPAFGNDDVWACLPDGTDTDVLSDGCVRVMSNRDGASEFTGIQFLGDGQSFLIHLQHRTQTGRSVSGTADELLISGLKIRGRDR